MTRMNYDTIVDIPNMSKIVFKHYDLDRHENKVLAESVEGILFTVVTPEERLDRELIVTYYPDLDERYINNVSYSPFYRLVIQTGTNRQGLPVYKTVELNKYYMIIGLQTVEYENYQPEQSIIPSQILGFSSYEIGSKFKL